MNSARLATEGWLSEILISLADIEQRQACYRLIYEIFCEEMGIMREDADHQNRIVRDRELDVSHVLHAQVGGELAGTLGIIIGTQDGTPFPEHFEREYEVARFLPVVPRHRMAFNIRFLLPLVPAVTTATSGSLSWTRFEPGAPQTQ